MNKIKKDNKHRNNSKNSKLIVLMKIFVKMSKRRDINFKLFSQEYNLKRKNNFVVSSGGRKVYPHNPEGLCNS